MDSIREKGKHQGGKQKKLGLFRAKSPKYNQNVKMLKSEISNIKHSKPQSHIIWSSIEDRPLNSIWRYNREPSAMVPWPRDFGGSFLTFLTFIGFIGFFLGLFYFSFYLGVQLWRSGGIDFFFLFSFFSPLSLSLSLSLLLII